MPKTTQIKSKWQQIRNDLTVLQCFLNSMSYECFELAKIVDEDELAEDPFFTESLPALIALLPKWNREMDEAIEAVSGQKLMLDLRKANE